MNKVISIIGWLVVALPFILESVFKIPAISSSPLLSSIASSLGVVIALGARVVTQIAGEGFKPFMASGTFQSGLIALATVWLGYYGIDYTQIATNVQTIVMSVISVIGLYNQSRAKKGLTIA